MKRTILIVLQVLLLVLFVVQAVGQTFAEGVCCADDSAHALIAKNLADGFGYSSTLIEGVYQTQVSVFPVHLGVGPTIILPAALMIKLFGNTYWAPGLSLIAVWTLLLLILLIIANRHSDDKAGLTVSALVFFVLIFQFTLYHREQWWALLGEVPAALLIILAVVVYFTNRSRVGEFLTGILFALAAQSKLLAMMPFAIFIVVIILLDMLEFFRQRQRNFSSLIRKLLTVGVGFLVPIALFEFWKIIALHPQGYLAYYQDFIAYFKGLGVERSVDLLNDLTQGLTTAETRFGISIPFLLILLTAGNFFLRKDRKVFPIYLVFYSMVVVYTIYWLFFSIGWARYYIIGLIILTAALAIPFSSTVFKRSHKWIYSAILAGVLAFNLQHIDTLSAFRNHNFFEPAPNTVALQTVSQKLSSEVDRRPFLTQWWASAVDIEYMMDTHLNFSTLEDINFDTNRSFPMVINKKFLVENDPRMDPYFRDCAITEYDRYLYLECDHPNIPK